MKSYFKINPWKIIEEGFVKENQKWSESIFSLGNGRMGGRGNFEEDFSGATLQGNYVAGIYYPDKTRVGWWKNGYPDYFAKVLNSAHWHGLRITVDDEILDLNSCTLHHFRRVLHMDKGYLERSFLVELKNGKSLEIQSIRFLSMSWDECGAMQYTIQSNDDHTHICIESILDFDIRNEDSNYDEDFWTFEQTDQEQNMHGIQCSTKKNFFHVGCAILNKFYLNGSEVIENYSKKGVERKQTIIYKAVLNTGDFIQVEKSMVQLSSLDYSSETLLATCFEKCRSWANIPFEQKLNDHANIWSDIWEWADIQINNDEVAQQSIRYNIFQLYQTYTGKDARFNIGPKGFTGEKYGGATYWDTEAYCIPFYLGTSPPAVSKNLLLYRYKQLDKAIENAQKLGFTNGAALFPMVTMNGEECHNEWEITFEEIHRNGAMVYAIYNYVNFTGDRDYLKDYGIDVVCAINRFWVQRVHFSNHKNQYVMHGVTGPNEYENNVNNNWYTLYIALWCLQYGLQILNEIKKTDAAAYQAILVRLGIKVDEINHWQEVSKNIYLPQDIDTKLLLQQEDYLDKEQLTTADLDPAVRPINQHWSWDRILRSPFIKQADVLQGLYFFEDHFTMDQIKINFDYYEPRTVHESSLSPCVHAILACRLGYEEKAKEMYLRTARLDLNDYNNDSDDGLHITSMAGTWMSVVQGFGGIKVNENGLHINPFLPKDWSGLQFKIYFLNRAMNIDLSANKVKIVNLSAEHVDFHYKGKKILLPAKECFISELT